MIYEYIRVTHRWQTNTYNWHTNGIWIHIDKIWVHTNDMQMTCKWNIRPYKGFGVFKSLFSKLFVVKTFKIIYGKKIVLGGCKLFLATTLTPILFIRIFLSSATGFGNLNNLRGDPYCILQPCSVLFFFDLIQMEDKLFYILSPVKIYVVLDQLRLA